MERRVERLEDAIAGISENMGEIRGELKHIATKEDIANLKVIIAGLWWKVPLSMLVALGAVAGIARLALMMWGAGP